MTIDEIRGLIRWHEYRASGWEFADPPEGDRTRCGGCGRPEADHPRPNVALVPQLHLVFVALLDVAEHAAALRLSTPEYVDEAQHRLSEALDALDAHLTGA